VALLSLLLAQESSLGSLLAGAECLETCPEDAQGGRCSPVCVACSCGSRLNPVPARADRLAEPEPRDGFELATPVVAPAEGHPPEISHVPLGVLS